VSAVEQYDPATDAWLELPPRAEPKWGIGAALFKSRILVAGGLLTDWNKPSRHTDTVEALDL
jgi:hypothetical protein